MQLVEQHVIDRNHPYFAEIDRAAFASKNLFNAVNYAVRQSFIFQNVWLRYSDLAGQFKSHEAFKALPAKVAQWTIKMLDKSWKSFFAAIKEWSVTPGKFTGRPALPKYKDKADGRNLLVYTEQAISSKLLKVGIIKLSGLSFHLKTKVKQVDQVRVVPRKGFYVVEVIYSVEPKPTTGDPSLVAGIDLGVNNLAVIASNKQGFTPLVVKGGPIKSINQFYNKRKADLQRYLPGKRETSPQIIALSNKRTRRINHFLHVSSRRIVDHLVAHGIGTLVIGKNDGWKQEVNKGKVNNQNFVTIPHARFIEMLTYKCELVCIKVITHNESHTSKCSFLDNEPICHQERYAGKRIKRGLFRSATGKLINADLNGALNIIRKAIPAAFGEGIEGVVVHPSPFGCK